MRVTSSSRVTGQIGCVHKRETVRGGDRRPFLVYTQDITHQDVLSVTKVLLSPVFDVGIK